MPKAPAKNGELIPAANSVPSVPSSGTPAVLDMIARAAADPNVDVDKLVKLHELRLSIEAREAEVGFNTALADAQGEIEPVARNQTNTHTRSRYADLYAVSEAVTPIMTRHGLSMSFGSRPSSNPGYTVVYCDLSHRLGHTRRYELEIPLDSAGSAGKTNKTPIQALGSTVTYARRYLTLMIANVPLTDDDGNAQREPSRPSTKQPINTASESGPIDDAQQEALRKLIAETQTNITSFLGYLRVESLSDIPSDQFDVARGLLLKKLRKQREAAQ